MNIPAAINTGPRRSGHWFKITRAFQINAGPLYIQLLVGDQGLSSMRWPVRIGGAHEDIFIPYLTGFDILDRVINFSLGIDPAPAGSDQPRTRTAFK